MNYLDILADECDKEAKTADDVGDQGHLLSLARSFRNAAFVATLERDEEASQGLRNLAAEIQTQSKKIEDHDKAAAALKEALIAISDCISPFSGPGIISAVNPVVKLLLTI